MRSLIAVALLGLSTNVFAADPTLGPEVPVSAPAFDAAAGDQRGPSLAWYGDSLAASWIDDRNDFPSVRIAQLDALGRPKGIAARASGPHTSARLAANGAATPLLATHHFGATFVSPAGTSGRGVRGTLTDLATDGSTYLLLTVESSVLAEMLDSDGITIRSFRIGTSVGDTAIAVPFDGAYHVIYTEGSSIRDAIVKRDGNVVDQHLATATNPRIAAAANGDALLIAWMSDNGIELMQRTAGGARTRSTFGAPAQKIFAGSDGRRFLIAWSDGAQLRAARLDADGAVDSQAFAISSSPSNDLTFARTPAGIVLAWSEGAPANVFTRGAASFDEIASAQTSLASVGYLQQQDVSLASRVVWSEGETSSRIQSADGVIAYPETGHSLRNPISVHGAGTTLIAWRDVAADRTSRVIAKLGDDAPMVIADSRFFRDFDVAFDGASFFVVWSDGSLHVTRIAPSGVELETTDIETTGNVSLLRATRIANTLAIVFVDGRNVMFSGDTDRPVAIAAETPSRPAIALDDRGLPLVVWSAGTCLFAAHRIEDGIFVARTVACSNVAFQAPAVAWSGSEFVLAWHEWAQFGYRNVRAIRVTRDAAPIDAKPFELTRPFRDAFAASIAPNATGVAIGYQRVAGEEPFDDVSRIFVRSLQRMTPLRRSRNIGR